MRRRRRRRRPAEGVSVPYASLRAAERRSWTTNSPGRGFGAASVFAAGSGSSAWSRPHAPGQRLAFANVRLFDGKSNALRAGLRVVVEGKTIKAVEPAESPVGEGVEVVDCGGRVLMPGLIDAHWHAMMAAIPLNVLFTADVGYINLVAAAEAERTLIRGFTSIRDMAGPSFALKRAIDGRRCKGTAHLAVRRDDFADGRTRRLSLSL